MLPLLLAAAIILTPASDLLWPHGCSPGSGLPEGWLLEPVAGVPRPEFVITESDGVCSLDINGLGAAAWAYRELESPLAETPGVLRWEWRRIEFPHGADLERRGGDDSPLRVYVVFGRPTLFGPARSIFYSLASRPAPPRLSFESARVAVVPLTPGELNVGPTFAAVDPFRDYRRFWAGEPDPITAVGVMLDTDATGGNASVELRALTWRASRDNSSAKTGV